MECLVKIVSILGIIGVPSIFSLTMWCVNCCRKYSRQLKILMESQQAQMRSHLIAQYKQLIRQYNVQGWIDVEDLDDWENQYQKYHLLGANGVLDAKRDELLGLSNVKRN